MRTASPSGDIVVRTSNETKRARLSQYLAANRPARITETEFSELRERLAPISSAYLQKLVRSSGLPLDAVVEGVRQARLAARRRAAPPETRAFKQEMAAWMLLWLENPAIFPTWLSLRKKRGPLAGSPASPE
jgi:hypothetical protein